ncbi:MAG: hypothetical protein H8E44_40530 [Planctomycetes bacterium]|nr:hypothetical protein [Planctomycetota bacterium]MBL7040645.1 hypothetical protein [Pirellulaceae bacterium]
MKYVGADLHEHSITICVMVKVRGKRKVEARRSLMCQDTEAIREFWNTGSAKKAIIAE